MFKCIPRVAVVVFPVGAVEGGMVHDFAGGGAAGEGVVGDAAGDDGACGEVADVLPAEGDAGLGRRGVRLLGVVDRPGSPGGGACRSSGVRRGVAGVALDGLAGEADAGEALGGGEDDAAVGVVPGVGFVLAHDGELDAVDGQELVEGQAEGHGGEDVDLDEGLAAGVVGAEGVLPSPFGGEGGEVVRQAGILPGPGVGAECGDGAHGFRGIGALVGSGDGVAGWLVRGNRVSGIAGGVPTGSDGSGDDIAGWFVRGNRVSGITGGVPGGSGDDVAGWFVRGNRVSGIAGGVPVGGGESAAGRFVRGNRVSGIAGGVPTGSDGSGDDVAG